MLSLVLRGCIVGALALAGYAGCVEADIVHCADGSVCPSGTRCGVPTGCIVAGECGDGLESAGEVCDDGNTVGGDGCSADCTSTEECGNTIVELAETCDDGNHASHDGCSSGCLTEALRWTSLGASGPSARTTMGAVFDPDRGRGVIYGGIDVNGATAETWYVTAAGWSAGPDGPRAVSATALASDGAGTILLYGGQTPTNCSTAGDCNTCATLDDTAWTACTPPATGRRDHTLAATPDGGILLLGGTPSNGATALPIVWTGTWGTPMPSNPFPLRSGLRGLFDPIKKLTYMIGGDGPSPDTWAWNGTTWTNLFTALPRYQAGVVYDADDRRVLAWGGQEAGGVSAMTSTWDGAGGWMMHDVAGGPGGRQGHAMFYDPIRHGTVVFGGSSSTAIFGDTWILRLESSTPDDACDGSDADGDGVTGCADPDCWARCTPRCPPGATCDPAAPHCGDGVCNSYLEDHALCPADC